MAKSFFEKMGGTYHEENGYLIPDLTARRRKAYQDMGTKALARSGMGYACRFFFLSAQ